MLRWAYERDPNSTLTLEWIKERCAPMRCEALGHPLRWNGGAHDLLAPSIDRIDSDLGYTPENRRITSMGYNFLQNARSDADVREWLRHLVP